MALWLVRAGRHGEHEQKFLDESKIFLTWRDLGRDIRQLEDREALRQCLQEIHPEASEGKTANHTGQIWAFLRTMEPGDLVVLPSKTRPALNIGEIIGVCEYDPSAPDWYQHFRKIAWKGRDVPRSNFDQDLLYSMGAIQTICRISRNDAEERVRAMAKAGWRATTWVTTTARAGQDGDSAEQVIETPDLERLARDEINKLIISRFQGHGLARLVDAVLRAQGYSTYVSPEGPDHGVDILAGGGPLGFDAPKICVQVKSSDSPVDRPTLDQLVGSIQNMRADHGLLVSWGGFKKSIDREEAAQFFRVRLWDQDEFVAQLLASYEKLDAGIRAELPLKRVWTVARVEEE